MVENSTGAGLAQAIGILAEEDWFVEKWRNAVRVKMKGFPCGATLEVASKSFDYATQLGVMVAMSIVTQNIGTLKWPRDWVEAVKERWLPERILKYWPIKYQRVDISAIYPKATLPDPVFKWKYTSSAQRGL